MRRRLNRHYEQLWESITAALRAAIARGQLRSEVDPEQAAAQLALLAYGVNPRSRAGARPAELTRTVTAALTTSQEGSHG